MSLTVRQAGLTLPPALRRWWDWHVDEAEGAPPKLADVTSMARKIEGAWKILGPAVAGRIYAETATSWTRETGRCDVCGGPAHKEA